MNVSLSKFTYIFREDGTLLITYGLFPEYLYNDLMDSIGEEPAIFLFNLIFCRINKFDSKMAQLLILTHVI